MQTPKIQPRQALEEGIARTGSVVDSEIPARPVHAIAPHHALSRDNPRQTPLSSKGRPW